MQTPPAHKRTSKRIVRLVLLLALAGSAGFLLAAQLQDRLSGYEMAFKTAGHNDVKNQLIRWKRSGALSYLSWEQVLSEFERGAHKPVRQTAFVRVRSRGTGACPAVWDTPVGPIGGRDADGPILWTFVFEQNVLHEYDTQHVPIKTGDIVLDVGGHLGTFTRFALLRAAGKIIAIEPDPVNIACYRQTFAEEIKAGRVVLIEAAAWNAETHLQFSTGVKENSGTGTLIRPLKTSHIDVFATTIDRALARIGVKHIDFVKMDIEGAEREALAGARELLARSHPRMAICIYHLKDDPVVIPNVVRAAYPGYHIDFGKTQAYFY